MDITLLKAVNTTLDCVEVKGRSNLRHMLGCMDALDSIIQAEEAAQNAAVSSVNWTHPGTGTENINVQEVDNG